MIVNSKFKIARKLDLKKEVKQNTILYFWVRFLKSN